MELVTSMWRQDRLRGLELATLTAAAEESPPSEATVRKLGTFARYGTRIDKDIGRALQALRVLRDRPDTWIDELRDGTREPGGAETLARDRTNELAPGTLQSGIWDSTLEFLARTLEPGPANANVETCTAEPEPPALSRQQRRRLEALARKRRAG